MVHPDVIQCESSHCACGWLSPGGIVSGFRGSGNVQCGSSMVVGLWICIAEGRQAGREEDEASETLERKPRELEAGQELGNRQPPLSLSRLRHHCGLRRLLTSGCYT